MSRQVGAFQASEQTPIMLTDQAVAAAKKAAASDGEQGDGLRVSVIGGGCSGYQYNLDFERERRDEDVLINYDGLTVYVDPVTAGYLFGTVIDFVTEEDGSGFRFNNPNPRRTCGCGSSFA